MTLQSCWWLQERQAAQSSYGIWRRQRVCTLDLGCLIYEFCSFDMLLNWYLEIFCCNVVFCIVVRTLTGHRSNCISVDFHPFGEFFASGSLDTNLKIWDIRKKGCIHTYKGHTRGVNAIRFTPDGRWVVSGGEDNTVKVRIAFHPSSCFTCHRLLYNLYVCIQISCSVQIKMKISSDLSPRKKKWD